MLFGACLAAKSELVSCTSVQHDNTRMAITRDWGTQFQHAVTRESSRTKVNYLLIEISLSFSFLLFCFDRPHHF